MATRNPPPQEYESDDDSYEVLDLTEYARRHHWWNRVFGHSSGPMVEKYSVATQIVMGGVSGWPNLVRSPIIGRSLLGKPRDRTEDISIPIVISHTIKQRIDMLVEHSPQDTIKTWMLLGSFAPFSESSLLSPLLRDTCAGFLFQKVGKLAATAVGGGFLLLQIASHSGYVQIDWKRVEKDVNKAKRQIKKRANKAAPEINNIIEEATEFVKQNIVISSGFVGGFLLGLAS